jgi:hypothetical protein
VNNFHLADARPRRALAGMAALLLAWSGHSSRREEKELTMFVTGSHDH